MDGPALPVPIFRVLDLIEVGETTVLADRFVHAKSLALTSFVSYSLTIDEIVKLICGRAFTAPNTIGLNPSVFRDGH
jgi:hypothetical protein